MDQISTFFNSLVPAGFDWLSFFKTLLILAAILLVLGLLGRLLFGKKSLLNQSLSTAISILLCCIVTVFLNSLGAGLEFLLSALPFLDISGNTLQLSLSDLATPLLSMVILCCFVNQADRWMPEGKGFFGWFFFRCCGVLLAMVLHRAVTGIVYFLLPDPVLFWASWILLGALVLMLLLGALHLLFGGKKALFRGLHDFFFKNEVGKTVYRAVLTTLILALLAWIASLLGVNSLYLRFDGIPSLAVVLILLSILFVISHLL